MAEGEESAGAALDAAARRKKRRQRQLGGVAGRSATTGLYATLAAGYLRLVNATSRLIYEPAGLYDVAGQEAPIIVVTWHGQAFMMPFIRPRGFPVDVLVSRGADGERMARTLHKLGCGTVRGSGARAAARSLDKGGASAFLAMRRRLQEGVSVALSADFNSKAPRQVSLGIVLLARGSGRPIVPAAIATSRRMQLDSWDRMTVNLPFSRAACVFGDYIEVPADADDDLLEARRRQVEDALNAATARAYEIAERRDG